MKIKNRFYIAAQKIIDGGEQYQQNHFVPNKGHSYPWTKATLEDAIAQATEMLDTQPALEHVAIVQIIRLVRRERSPVVVETVKA